MTIFLKEFSPLGQKSAASGRREFYANRYEDGSFGTVDGVI
jgi:hypothetical protein